MLNFLLRFMSPVVILAVLAAVTKDIESQQIPKGIESSTPLPVYPAVRFQVLNVDHVVLRQDSSGLLGNSSLKVHTQTFLITDPGPGSLKPVLNASYGPHSVDAPIPPELLLSGRRIVSFILGRQVRSSSPAVKILFHMPRKGDGAQEKMTDGAHCVTAYAFWGTREVRGACLVSPGRFCVAELKPEPAWFSSSTRSGSSSKEAGRPEAIKGLQGNLVEVYFQSRMDQTGRCTPQDSLQRVGVGRAGVKEESGTPMRRIGSVSLLKTPPGNPTFSRLRLGGVLVIQTSSKPLKTDDILTFYVFLASTSTLEGFTLRATVKPGLSFSAVRPSDAMVWDVKAEPGRVVIPNTVSVVCQRKVPVTAKRGLFEVFQLDFVPKDISDLVETHTISWRLDQPGNVRDVGQMRIYTTQRDFVGLAPLVMSTDILNTAMLTGKALKVPVKTLAVEANGSITDVSSLTSCRATEKEVIKVSERCDYVFVTGKESRGKRRVMINFTYGFLSAQLEMSVWMPRLPLRIDVADPELNQIKGWRVPITTSNRKPTWNSEEEEEMRKGRGCMLQYQHSTLRVLTQFEADSDALPDLLTGAKPVDYFLGPDWQVDVTNLVRYSLKVANPDVAWVKDGEVLQGRAVGATTVQVLSPLTSSVLGEKAVTVVDDKVSVTELGVQLVSGLSLSLQPSPLSNSAIVAMATTRETITQLKQEAAVNCWVQFSDGAIVPLAIFDGSIYSLTVSTPDEAVATIRRTPQFTFAVAQGEGQGQVALVRVELRICEECQKSKRKSKLVVGAGLLRMKFQGAGQSFEGNIGLGKEKNRYNGGTSEIAGEVKTTVTSQRFVTDADKAVLRTVPETSTLTKFLTAAVQSRVSWTGSTNKSTQNSEFMGAPTSTIIVDRSPNTTGPTDIKSGVFDKGEQSRGFGNMVDNPNSPPNKGIPKADVSAKKEPPKAKSPKFIESDLIQTFRSMSDLEIGIYSLVAVLCIAILGFLLNCASYRLCFRNHKSPVQAGPTPSGDPNDHKHDWVWLESNNQHLPAPGAPAQVSTLTRRSTDSKGQRSTDSPLPAVGHAVVGIPERTATLGRNRTGSQQQLHRKVVDPMANRSATLLARPHRSEPLHSPTSKRNQVQFTTFTTLDIKHLAALKKNGMDFHWTNQQQQVQFQQQASPADPQMPLPDMPWPIVKPLGEPQ
ncbi:transmembrane protein 132D-like [Syngnathoides biaculeatus]|uniref:transmembrane protein 132D-like n=1 Tax=Syngnathoides biaculeatus TaxID=300417 RepID=UPI002ADD429D|nr:transmembrane protein 132D-like [Syngnathoides biaculeatus]